MFAVKDKRSGKFLRGFSDSYNRHFMLTKFKLEGRLSRRPTDDEIHKELWCLDSPDGAKIYKNEGAIANSFYSHRARSKNRRIYLLSLSEALPWLEIVEVKLSVR